MACVYERVLLIEYCVIVLGVLFYTAVPVCFVLAFIVLEYWFIWRRVLFWCLVVPLLFRAKRISKFLRRQYRWLKKTFGVIWSWLMVAWLLIKITVFVVCGTASILMTVYRVIVKICRLVYWTARLVFVLMKVVLKLVIFVLRSVWWTVKLTYRVIKMPFKCVWCLLRMVYTIKWMLVHMIVLAMICYHSLRNKLRRRR